MQSKILKIREQIKLKNEKLKSTNCYKEKRLLRNEISVLNIEIENLKLKEQIRRKKFLNY